MSTPFLPARYANEPSGQFAESVRSLRTAIIRQLRLGIKSFLVTSSWRSEGKSLVCLNLGISLGEIGLSVLLVDRDLRSRGLTQWVLPDQVEPQAEPQSLPWANLHFLAAPSCGESPAADILSQAEFKRHTLKHFSAYSVVLIDSPAMVLCSDALSLGAWVDGAILTVSKRRFQGVAEGNFVEDLRAAGIPVIGTVLT